MDGARVWIELDGIATLGEEDGARVFVTSVRFHTGDERYTWLNTLFGVLEGVLDSVGVGGVARGLPLVPCHGYLIAATDRTSTSCSRDCAASGGTNKGDMHVGR
jgi:hypothetical protein